MDGLRYTNVPPGDYTLRVFHERATAATLENASRSVAVIGDTVGLPPITISESGYLPFRTRTNSGTIILRLPDEAGFTRR